jgi:hypothetical protein
MDGAAHVGPRAEDLRTRDKKLGLDPSAVVERQIDMPVALAVGKGDAGRRRVCLSTLALPVNVVSRWMKPDDNCQTRPRAHRSSGQS